MRLLGRFPLLRPWDGVEQQLLVGVDCQRVQLQQRQVVHSSVKGCCLSVATSGLSQQAACACLLRLRYQCKASTACTNH